MSAPSLFRPSSLARDLRLLGWKPGPYFDDHKCGPKKCVPLISEDDRFIAWISAEKAVLYHKAVSALRKLYEICAVFGWNAGPNEDIRTWGLTPEVLVEIRKLLAELDAA